TGAGISREDLDKIFERFYRVEGQWEKDGSGAGIGLSLSNEFVKLLKGTIKVNSEPGSGSLFEISIPLGKDHLKKGEYIIVKSVEEGESCHPHPAEQFIETEEKDPLPNEKNLHILVIEDNADLRTFITDNLLHEYHIYEADNGKSGLSVAMAKIPDLIVTDVIMPDMDGIELCSRIKNDERTSHIPVIMLTAKTTTDDKIEGLKSGADDYIYKPFDIKELKVRISNLIALREKLRIRFGALTGLERPGGPDESVDDRFMRKVSSVILENLKDFDFDVGGLEEKIGMSRVHLFRKIKAITGLSPSALIRKYRMKEAANILGRESVNVSVLAMTVGFSNPSHFSKCFREYYGISPREYAERKNKP
ncbi:MAG: response regulator, partial [Bacteroidales bacterium]|nr:response regulator [Bacteroidales bacterium]